MPIIFSPISTILAIAPDIPSGCHHGFYGYGSGECCTESNQCGVGEGDCDEDIDCFGDLKCGNDNCDPYLGFSDSHDCCFNPNISKKMRLESTFLVKDGRGSSSINLEISVVALA